MLISGITGIDLTGLPINNSGNTEVEGNLNLSGVGARITGDFSNATLNSRTILKTNVTNGVSVVHITPDGTGSTAGVYPSSSSDLTNAPYVGLAHNTVLGGYINCSAYGSGIPTNFSIKIAGTDAMVIDTSRNIGIGTSSPATALNVNTASETKCALYLQKNLSSVALIGAESTWLGTGTSNNAVLAAYGTNSLILGTGGIERVRIDTAGNVLLTSGTGGLGYRTGAGGTVTQLTSKSTAVTLNKPAGQIIMNGGALAAGATAYFVLNNSLITTNDLIYPTSDFGGAVYSIIPYVYTNGSVTFAVKHDAAVSRSDSILIRYILIKGANA